LEYGVKVKLGSGETRIEVQCAHQNGLIYVVPSEASWVCQPEYIHSHAIAGFFRELIDMNDPKVTDLMQRWGLYYRSRPLDEE
jgi:hypothetical protein